MSISSPMPAAQTASDDTTTGPPQAVSIEDVAAVTQEVWSTLLGLDLHPAATSTVPSPSVTGCVQITGEWEGAVLLSCSEQFARTATEAMFMTDEVTEDDIIDAVGELTNMVGGNVKSLLPGPSQLSVPSVASGEKYTMHVPGTTLLHQLVLGCGRDPIFVSIWHS